MLIKAHRVPGLQSPVGKRLPKSGVEALLLPVQFGSFYFSYLIMQNRGTFFFFLIIIIVYLFYLLNALKKEGGNQRS